MTPSTVAELNQRRVDQLVTVIRLVRDLRGGTLPYDNLADHFRYATAPRDMAMSPFGPRRFTDGGTPGFYVHQDDGFAEMLGLGLHDPAPIADDFVAEVAVAAGRLGIRIGQYLNTPEGDVAQQAACAALGAQHGFCTVMAEALRQAADLEARGDRERAIAWGAGTTVGIATIVLMAWLSRD